MVSITPDRKRIWSAPRTSFSVVARKEKRPNKQHGGKASGFKRDKTHIPHSQKSLIEEKDDS